MSECKDLSIGDAHTLALRSNGINDFVAARDRLARLVVTTLPAKAGSFPEHARHGECPRGRDEYCAQIREDVQERGRRLTQRPLCHISRVFG